MPPLSGGASPHLAAARLTPDAPVHFDWIGELLRAGAREGAFDPDLARRTPESDRFFANLKRALATGHFTGIDPGGGLHDSRVAGYVYGAAHPRDHPMGFVLLKELTANVNELWLTAVDPLARHTGVGSAMIRALLDTVPGQLTYVSRVNAASAHGEAMSRLLVSTGFDCVRTGTEVDWYVHRNAPPSLVEFVRTAPAALPLYAA